MAQIYALLDPHTGEIRYIGKAKDAAKRLKTHVRDSRRRNTPVYCWMRDLDRTPGMRVLVDTEDGEAEEIRLIAEHRAAGCRLLNIAPGGDQPFSPPEARVRAGERIRGVTDNIHADPQRRRIWELKRSLVEAVRRGYITHERLADRMQARMEQNAGR